MNHCVGIRPRLASASVFKVRHGTNETTKIVLEGLSSQNWDFSIFAHFDHLPFRFQPYFAPKNVFWCCIKPFSTTPLRWFSWKIDKDRPKRESLGLGNGHFERTSPAMLHTRRFGILSPCSQSEWEVWAINITDTKGVFPLHTKQVAAEVLPIKGLPRDKSQRSPRKEHSDSSGRVTWHSNRELPAKATWRMYSMFWSHHALWWQILGIFQANRKEKGHLSVEESYLESGRPVWRRKRDGNRRQRRKKWMEPTMWMVLESPRSRDSKCLWWRTIIVFKCNGRARKWPEEGSFSLSSQDWTFAWAVRAGWRGWRRWVHGQCFIERQTLGELFSFMCCPECQSISNFEAVFGEGWDTQERSRWGAFLACLLWSSTRARGLIRATMWQRGEWKQRLPRPSHTSIRGPPTWPKWWNACSLLHPPTCQPTSRARTETDVFRQTKQLSQRPSATACRKAGARRRSKPTTSSVREKPVDLGCCERLFSCWRHKGDSWLCRGSILFKFKVPINN